MRLTKTKLGVFFTGVAVAAALMACSPDSSSSANGPEQQDPAPASSSSDSVSLSSCSNEILEEASSSSAETVPNSSEVAPASSSTSWIAENSSSSASEPLSSSSDDVKYLWNDEFEGSTIDTDKWTFEIGTGASGWGNNEWEYYTDRSENAYVKDGVLHIRANKESYEGASYTSARMITKGKFSFTYGTVEARIALPTGKGI